MSRRKDLMKLREDGFYIRQLAGYSSEALKAELDRIAEVDKLKSPEFEAMRETAYENEQYLGRYFYFEGKDINETQSVFSIIAKWHYVTGEIHEGQKAYHDLPCHKFMEDAWNEDGIIQYEGTFEEGRKLLLEEGFEEKEGILKMFWPDIDKY
jgi:hypothetical protein